MLISRNIYRCKSTIFRSPFYSLERAQTLNCSSCNLTPSHTIRDTDELTVCFFSRRKLGPPLLTSLKDILHYEYVLTWD